MWLKLVQGYSAPEAARLGPTRRRSAGRARRLPGRAVSHGAATGTAADAGFGGAAGRGTDPSPSATRKRIFPNPPAVGGACDWLQADGRRVDWRLGAWGPDPRGRVRPRTYKWEAPRRRPQIQGCAADLRVSGPADRGR